MNPDITKLLIAIASGLIGVFFGHFLTRDRDAATRQSILDREADVRRRQFKKFILKTGFAFERTNGNEDRAVWGLYESVAPDILAEASSVEGDVGDPEALMAAVRRAGEWRSAEAKAEADSRGCELREVLRESIRSIEAHIRK